MRKSLFLCCAVGLFAAVSPAVLCAQFQPPNPDELKMTSDPKAPGAAAVYLDYEETDNDSLHSQIYYARIKVLTEKGKERRRFRFLTGAASFRSAVSAAAPFMQMAQSSH